MLIKLFKFEIPQLIWFASLATHSLIYSSVPPPKKKILEPPLVVTAETIGSFRKRLDECMNKDDK